jgi:hypothetical protein
VEACRRYHKLTTKSIINRSNPRDTFRLQLGAETFEVFLKEYTSSVGGSDSEPTLCRA